MKLLLDTHIFIWLIEGNPNLSQAAREAIEDDFPPTATQKLSINHSETGFLS